jgi:hypothetical protein
VPRAGFVLAALGLVAHRDGDRAAASRLYARSLAAWQQVIPSESELPLEVFGRLSGVGFALEGVAHLAAEQGDAASALRLLGAARTAHAASRLFPLLSTRDLSWIERAEQALGERAAATVAEGSALPLRQAIGEALALVHPSPGPTPAD